MANKINYTKNYWFCTSIQGHSAGWCLLIVLALRKSLNCWPDLACWNSWLVSNFQQILTSPGELKE